MAMIGAPPRQRRALPFGIGDPARAERGAIWPAWSLLLLAALALVDLLWIAATPLSVSAAGAGGPLLGLAFAALSAFALRHMALPAKPRMLLAGLAFMLAAWPVLRLFNHLAMTVPMPLADPWLAYADRALGFDWLAYARWVDAQPVLIQLMRWAYGGLTLYSALTFVLILSVIGVKRAREFTLLFLLTAIGASALGMFFPAEAAMTHYAPDLSQFRSISGRTGTYHIALLHELRGNPAHVFLLDKMPGLTTFPSFHTAMGLLGIWCARGHVKLFVPVLAVNALMIASTPVLGSHYLIDLIGGLLLTVGAILLLRWTERPAKPAALR